MWRLRSSVTSLRTLPFSAAKPAQAHPVRDPMQKAGGARNPLLQLALLAYRRWCIWSRWWWWALEVALAVLRTHEKCRKGTEEKPHKLTAPRDRSALCSFLPFRCKPVITIMLTYFSAAATQGIVVGARTGRPAAQAAQRDELAAFCIWFLSFPPPRYAGASVGQRREKGHDVCAEGRLWCYTLSFVCGEKAAEIYRTSLRPFRCCQLEESVLIREIVQEAEGWCTTGFPAFFFFLVFCFCVCCPLSPSLAELLMEVQRRTLF